MIEPTVRYASLREAEDEIHIECRMSDGQKGAFIIVDVEFPALAQRIVDMLNAENTG